MTERQSGEFFNPGVDHEPSVNGVDTSFGYNKRRMDEKTDELVRLAREAHEADKDFQFVNDNKSVVSDEKIYGTIDRMFEIDREVNTVLAGNTAKENDLFDEDKVNDGFVGEKTFWEKFQEGVIGSKVVKRVSSLIVAAATMFQLGSAIPVQADESTPAPADPNATHSAEADENKTEDNFPTDVNGATLAPGDPLKEIQFPGIVTLTSEDKEDLSCRILDPEADLISLEELTNAIANYKQEVTLTSNKEYLKKLRDYGCTETNPGLLMSYINVLSAIDSSKKKDAQGNPTNYSTLSKYISEDSVLKYSVSKEGLTYYSVDNSPPILIVGGNEKINKSLFKSFDWYKKNGNFDIPEFFRKNGVYMLWFSEFNKDAGYGAAAIYEPGIIRFNFDAKDAKKYKDSRLSTAFKYIFTTEVEGIPIMSLIRSINMDLHNGYLEIAKSLSAQEDSLNMYKKTGVKFYLDLSKEMEAMAVSFSEEYNVSLDDPKLIRLIDVVTASNLVTPLSSDTWGFYKS